MNNRFFTYISRMKNLLTILAMGTLLSSCGKSEGNNNNTVLPVLSSQPVTLPEGNSGTTSFEFLFTLNKASTKEVSVRLTSLDGWAKSGLDYKKVEQILVFAPGETSKKLVVEVVGDDAKEGADDFSILLSEPKECSLLQSGYKGTIQNDDTKVVFSNDGFTTPTTYPGYTLAWADEFSGTAVDAASWTFENGDGCPGVCGWGNNELQWYTQGDNASVVDGKLIIEARPETRGTKNYTSTRMITKNKKTFKFGRIDIRAKLPYGKGIWPALWMLPQEDKFGGWPRSGEIDIMELLGQEPTKLYATVHYGPGPGSTNISRSTIAPAPLSDAFHVYSMIWEADRMRFLLDDVVFAEVKKADLGGNNYPFNEQFFFIFNMAVGGNWPGSPDATTYFPQFLIVDYVRVFQ